MTLMKNTLLDGPQRDWEIEWQDMPEFIQEKSAPFFECWVRFRNQKDLDEFSKLIGQNLTTKTKFFWYPKQERDDNKKFRYVDEETLTDES